MSDQNRGREIEKKSEEKEIFRPEIYRFKQLSDFEFTKKIVGIKRALLEVIIEREWLNAPCQPETPTWDDFKNRERMIAHDKRSLSIGEDDPILIFRSYFFGILIQEPSLKELLYFPYTDNADRTTLISLEDRLIVRKVLTGKSLTIRAVEHVLGTILSGFCLCR